MRSLSIALAGSIFALAFTPQAEACHKCRKARVVNRPVLQPRSTVATQAPAAPTPAGFPIQASPQGDDAATFLAMLNAARAQAGRNALAWDAGLAAYAASNAGVHMPGSTGGASQCWAQTTSYRSAFRMWAASPAHWSILMNARTSVGVSLCPTGCTANAR